MSENTNKGELLMKLYKLAVERDTLKQQNAELVAQVEVIKLKFNLAQDDITASLSVPQKSFDDLQDAIRSTPAQCLLEVKAEAGREGWKACVEYIIENTNCKEFSEQDIKTTLDVGLQYANKIRGGE